MIHLPNFEHIREQTFIKSNIKFIFNDFFMKDVSTILPDIYLLIHFEYDNFHNNLRDATKDRTMKLAVITSAMHNLLI